MIAFVISCGRYENYFPTLKLVKIKVIEYNRIQGVKVCTHHNASSSANKNLMFSKKFAFLMSFVFNTSCTCTVSAAQFA